GSPKRALAVRDRIDASDCVLTATKGLAYLALGEVSTGMHLYREAANLADRGRDDKIVRSLMTIHQAMGLRRLGILNSEKSLEIRATALPPVELPRDWGDLAVFRFLCEVAARRGWPWPIVVS